MSDPNGWPDASKPGMPLNSGRDAFHWLMRKGGTRPEAWRWDPDADGCGTEYSGAWAENDGDGQPDGMARWYAYSGPCLPPAEVAALVAEAEARGREVGLREAADYLLMLCASSPRWGSPEEHAAAILASLKA